MIRVTFLALLSFIFIAKLSSQTGVITNTGGRESLVGATVYAIKNAKGAVSDDNGFFTLSLMTFPDTLVVSYLGYQQALIPIETENAFLEIKLQRAASFLPDITVKAYREPEQISPEQRSIIDFLVLDEVVMILIHTTRSPNYRIQLTNLSGDVLDEKGVEKPRPEGLFKACLGGIYLLYENFIIELTYEKHLIRFLEKSNIQDFNRYLKPCILADQDYVYTGYHRKQSQIFTVFATPATGKESIQLAEIYSKDLLRRLSDEQRFKANKARTLEGHSSEQRIVNMYHDEKIFADRVIYQPVNVQLFRIEEELLLFDFANHQINAFRHGNKQVHREVPFIFHQRRPFAAQILQDPVSQKLYTTKSDRKYTYVYEIDPRTGFMNEVAVIPEIYLKHLQISDGTLYYLHKGITFEDRWQYLYRVKVA